MTVRSLVHVPIWLLFATFLVVVPAIAVATQALVRRLWPAIVEGRHNDVAGFLIAVVGVLYAVTLAFIVIVAWEEFRSAREIVDDEAAALRGLERDTAALPEPARSQMRTLTVEYGEEVAGPEWKAMDDGGSSQHAFDLVTQMFSTLQGAVVTTPAEQNFHASALNELNQLSQSRARRLSASANGPPSVLWGAILFGGLLTMGFALLFGVENERIHYVMVGGLAAILAVQVFTIVVLSFPFAGNVRVSPEPIERVVADFRG